MYAVTRIYVSPTENTPMVAVPSVGTFPTVELAMEHAETSQPPERTTTWSYELTNTDSQLRSWRFGAVAGTNHASAVAVHPEDVTPEQARHTWVRTVAKAQAANVELLQRKSALLASATKRPTPTYLTEQQALGLINTRRQQAGRQPYTPERMAQLAARARTHRA